MFTSANERAFLLAQQNDFSTIYGDYILKKSYICIIYKESSQDKISKTYHIKTMDQQKVDMFLMSNANKFPEERMFFIREHLANLDDSKAGILYTLQLKDPTMALVLSLMVGGFGVDRFYLGQTGMGILKFITCGGLGIWAIVDWFLIIGATRDYNLEKLHRFLSY